MEPQIDYQKLAHAMLQQAAGGQTDSFGYKAAGSTPTFTPGHGPGGAFSSFGLDPRVFNAMILPHLGLQAILPIEMTTETNPLFGILTGVTATSGSQPSTACAAPKTAGLAKLCTHSLPLGRFSLQSNVLNLERFGEYTNRGESRDLRLFGNPLGEVGGGAPSTGATANDVLQNEVGKAMFEFAASWAREYAPVLYDGTPTNNVGDGYKEFNGLDTLINTGRRDAETGVACAAADSIVESFSNQNISANGGKLVRLIQSVYHRLRFNAQRMGLNPVRWVISMRYGLFYELTEAWPYYYLLQSVNNIAIQNGVQLNMGGNEAVLMRDRMRGDMYNRRGQYLLIDGEQVPVILDDAIPETETSAGVFSSSIYFVPMTALGGTRVTFMEYFNWAAQNGALDGARALAGADDYYVTDNGAYFWHRMPPTHLCVQVEAWSRPRLVMLTPQIAARITNVAYSPVKHERDAFTDGAYFVNGGATSRTGPSYYTPTA